jgi:hypothetical protein
VGGAGWSDNATNDVVVLLLDFLARNLLTRDCRVHADAGDRDRKFRRTVFREAFGRLRGIP